jgi:hypothetical protein
VPDNGEALDVLRWCGIAKAPTSRAANIADISRGNVYALIQRRSLEGAGIRV